MRWILSGLMAVGVALGGCKAEPDVNNYYENNTYILGDTDSSDDETDSVVDSDTDVEFTSYLPACDNVVPVGELEIDLFGTDGHTFYFEVTPAQRLVGDNQTCRGGSNFNQGVYELGDTDFGATDERCPNWATNVRFVPAGQAIGNITCSDLGKVGVDTVGQSSWRLWSDIPNIKLKIDEFTDQKFEPSGEKNLRLNNGQADSTIVREPVALRIFKAMGYPAPASSYVRVQTNIWDTELFPGVWSAQILRQQYKKAFFASELPMAESVWEGVGDPFASFDNFGGGGAGWYEVECEWSAGDDCNNAALDQIVQRVQTTPFGKGFMQATSDIIDWPALHQNQCLSFITGTGDDWIHNTNNVVLVLREDGKVQYLPYSVDISGDHPWYQDVQYDGYAFLTDACRLDPDCRMESLLTCSEMIQRFRALDVPTTIVDERCDALRSTGLLRGPDITACEQVREFYTAQPDQLAYEIDRLILEASSSDTGDTGFDTAFDTDL